jgi:hypothetical protein
MLKCKIENWDVEVEGLGVFDRYEFLKIIEGRTDQIIFIDSLDWFNFIAFYKIQNPAVPILIQAESVPYIYIQEQLN